MRDIKALHPRLQEKVAELVEICKSQGLKIGISECVRTKAEQDALYAKGRTAPGSVVTNAKGSTYSSMHQWGVAFDFYRNDGKGAYNEADGFFEKVGKLGENIGLMWGGRWKSPIDKPHFQLPDWGATATKLKKLYKTPEGFMRSWGNEEMTDAEKKAFNLLKERVDALEKKAEKVYRTIDEIPSWARPTIKKLLEKGLYNGSGNGDLNLPESIMRTLVVNDRAGIYS